MEIENAFLTNILENDKNMKYGLKQQIVVHSSDVRCIDINENILVTGSLDKSVCIFEYNNDKKEYELINKLEGIWEGLVYSVSINKDNSKIGIGTKDKNIYIVDIIGNPIGFLEGGHEGIVNCIQWQNNNRLLSGGWDGRCVLWDVEACSEIKRLTNHKYAVTILVLANNNTCVTSSQDKALNIIDINSLTIIKRLENAHQDIVREISEIPHVGIVSVSNDETIKIFDYQLQLQQNIQQLSGFIFSVYYHDQQIFTGGDDSILRIYSDQQYKQVQQIPQVGVIWKLKVHPHNSDVFLALSDGSVQIFTKRINEQISEDLQYKYQQESLLQQNKQPGQQMSQQELEKLEKEEDLINIKGKKDGQIKIFRTMKNTAMAYQWSQQKQDWIKVGEVLGQQQQQQSLSRKYYPGDQWFQQGEYDYLFDIQLEQGNTTFLPFNNGDNVLQVAEKFIVREQISKNYLPQIMNFIKQNTSSNQNQNINKNQPIEQQQNSNKQNQSKHFPLKGYIYFEGINVVGLKKKLLEYNEQLKQQNSNQFLNDTEINHLNTLLEIIQNLQENQKKKLSTFQYDVIYKILEWPVEMKIPILDLLRQFLLHHQSEKLFSGVDSGINYVMNFLQILKQENQTEQIKTLVLKIMSNMHSFTQNQNSLYRFGHDIFDTILLIQNKYLSNNFRTALSTFFFNYSIGYFSVSLNLYNDKHFNSYIQCLLQVINAEQLNINTYKLSVSLGNILINFQNKIENKQIIHNILNNKQLQYDAEYDKIKESFRDIISI